MGKLRRVCREVRFEQRLLLRVLDDGKEGAGFPPQGKSMAIRLRRNAASMSRKFIIGASLLLTTAVLTAPVSAQEPCNDHDCKESFHYSFYRNKMWPLPFRAMDTKSVLDYFAVQRDNGWKLNNTLGASMFDPTTNQLTDSGKAHVHWIVNRAPQNRRVVFVLQADAPNATAARVESTQLAISQFVPVGALPQLYLTDQDAPGSSGVYQTAVTRARATSVPAPRLAATGAQSP